MNQITHPSSHISAPILETIRRHAAEAENLHSLTPEQLQTIYDHGWFKMFVPKIDNGLELSLPEALRIEEALAWADGSAGWVVTLCGGAGWFAGFLDRALSRKIFANPKVCLAGSGAATGTAEVLPEGFLLNGRWNYASGSLHATMFTANCVLTVDGTPLRDEHGNERVQSFIFEKQNVQLIRNWQSMGMVATGSHAFAVRDLFVPTEHTFRITPSHTTIDLPDYQYPFLQLAEATLAVNISGMTQQFVDLCGGIFESRAGRTSKKVNLHEILDTSRHTLLCGRRELYDAAERSWQLCTTRKPLPEETLLEVSNASRQLYDTCRFLVNTLYPYAGLTAANTSTELNRVWRNLNTATQHTLFTMY